MLSAVSAIDLKHQRGQLATYGAVRPGDSIVSQGTPAVVTAVRRARGRKPKVGENLHVVTDQGLVKVNSLAPVRMLRSVLHAAK